MWQAAWSPIPGRFKSTRETGLGRAVARLASRVVGRPWYVLRREWYVYIAGALLYASAAWLGNFVLFLIGTVIIITTAVVIGEVDRKAESKAARAAQERRQ